MDGFDDLLAPSRSALEENPFQDPFAKRSNSPDPWSTPFAQHADSQNAFTFDQDRSTTPTTTAEATESNEHGPSSTSTPEDETASDPLDSTAQTADSDDDEPLHRASSPRSPGFRESVPTSFSEIATIRPSQPEPSIPAPEEPYRSPSPHTDSLISSPPTQLQPDHISYSAAVSPSPSSLASDWESSVPGVSPLERPAPVAIVDRSFASLALGGESSGPWQGGQSSWSNERSPSDDDSDDDKPIMQTLKHSGTEYGFPTPVSIDISCTYTTSLIVYLEPWRRSYSEKVRQ